MDPSGDDSSLKFRPADKVLGVHARYSTSIIEIHICPEDKRADYELRYDEVTTGITNVRAATSVSHLNLLPSVRERS